MQAFPFLVLLLSISFIIQSDGFVRLLSNHHFFGRNSDNSIDQSSQHYTVTNPFTFIEILLKPVLQGNDMKNRNGAITELKQQLFATIATVQPNGLKANRKQQEMINIIVNSLEQLNPTVILCFFHNLSVILLLIYII